MQENLSQEVLSDHENGVLVQEGPQRVLEVLRRNGFNLLKQTTDTASALWTLAQSGGGGSAQPHPVPAPVPHPTPSGDGEADAAGEDQAEEEGEGGDEEEEAEE